jgi:hypothetical protein
VRGGLILGYCRLPSCIVLVPQLFVAENVVGVCDGFELFFGLCRLFGGLGVGVVLLGEQVELLFDLVLGARFGETKMSVVVARCIKLRSGETPMRPLILILVFSHLIIR